MILTTQKQTEQQLSAEEFRAIGQHDRQSKPTRSACLQPINKIPHDPQTVKIVRRWVRDGISRFVASPDGTITCVYRLRMKEYKASRPRDHVTETELGTKRLRIGTFSFSSKALAQKKLDQLRALKPNVKLVAETVYVKTDIGVSVNMTIFAETIVKKRTKRKLTRKRTVLHTDRASRRVSAARDANGLVLARTDILSELENERKQAEAGFEFRCRARMAQLLSENENGKYRRERPQITRTETRRGEGNFRVQREVKRYIALPQIGITADGFGCEPESESAVTVRDVRFGQKFEDQTDSRTGMTCHVFSRLLAKSGLQRRDMVHPLRAVSLRGDEHILTQFETPEIVERFSAFLADSMVRISKIDDVENLLPSLRAELVAEISRHARDIVDSLSRGASLRSATAGSGIGESTLRLLISRFAGR